MEFSPFSLEVFFRNFSPTNSVKVLFKLTILFFRTFSQDSVSFAFILLDFPQSLIFKLHTSIQNPNCSRNNNSQ